MIRIGFSQTFPSNLWENARIARRRALRHISVTIESCPESGSPKSRDIASVQNHLLICDRGIFSSLGHEGTENTCGVEVTGIPVTASS
jgi:hypothetical protein